MYKKLAISEHDWVLVDLERQCGFVMTWNYESYASARRPFARICESLVFRYVTMMSVQLSCDEEDGICTTVQSETRQISRL